MAEKIENHCWVIIRRDKHMKLVKIRPRQKEHMAKTPFFFDGALGHHFGSSFEIVKNRLIRIDPKTLLLNGPHEEPDVPEDASDINGNASALGLAEIDGETSASSPQPAAGVDNRNLLDRDANQRLNRDDIEELRAKGASGTEIVGHLVENSITFKAKTEYSKEKYLKRKKKKYLSVITILRPSTRLLCEMYYNKGPSKLCGLRLDSLTQLLLFSNVRSGSKLMVVESALGMVVGAMMERMGGNGALIHFFQGSAPQRPAYLGYNFPSKFEDSYYEYPLERVRELFEDGKDEGKENGEVEEKKEEDKATTEFDGVENGGENRTDKEEMKDVEVDKDQTENCDDGKEPPKKRLKHSAWDQETYDDYQQRRSDRKGRQNSAKMLVKQKNMDGLVVCSKFHPTPIVAKLIDFVAPSRPLVIFNQLREPLIDVYSWLKNSGRAVNLKLTESWMREYQVLPMRTHPLMQMSGGGGFLLTAYIVEP